MTTRRRVVVTGIGLVSSLGIGTEANWAALSAGKSGIDTITKFDASQFATRIAGEVSGFDPLQFIEKKDVKKMGRFIQFAIAASRVRDGRFRVQADAGERAERRRVHRQRHRRVRRSSSASTRRCSRAARGRSRRFSFRRRSSTWRPARSRFGSAPKARTRRPARPARPRRTRLATPSRLSTAATRT